MTDKEDESDIKANFVAEKVIIMSITEGNEVNILNIKGGIMIVTIISDKTFNSFKL